MYRPPLTQPVTIIQTSSWISPRNYRFSTLYYNWLTTGWMVVGWVGFVPIPVNEWHRYFSLALFLLFYSQAAFHRRERERESYFLSFVFHAPREKESERVRSKDSLWKFNTERCLAIIRTENHPNHDTERATTKGGKLAWRRQHFQADSVHLQQPPPLFVVHHSRVDSKGNKKLDIIIWDSSHSVGDTWILWISRLKYYRTLRIWRLVSVSWMSCIRV